MARAEVERLTGGGWKGRGIVARDAADAFILSACGADGYAAAVERRAEGSAGELQSGAGRARGRGVFRQASAHGAGGNGGCLGRGAGAGRTLAAVRAMDTALARAVHADCARVREVSARHDAAVARQGKRGAGRERMGDGQGMRSIGQGPRHRRGRTGVGCVAGNPPWL